MENNKKIIIGAVLTLGLYLLIKKYRNPKKTSNTPTSTGSGLNIPPRVPPKDEQPSTGGSLVLNNNGQLVTTGGIRPPKIEEPIKDPIMQEPMPVTPPAPLPFDFGNGDDGILVQEPFFGDNLFGGLPNININPIRNVPEPILVAPTPLPFDFGNGNTFVPEPINNVGGGSGDDSWNAFNNNTYSNTTLLGGNQNDVRGYSNLEI